MKHLVMNWPKRIVFVRHAQSIGNVISPHDISLRDKANHRFELTPRGQAQAQITGEYLHQQYGAFDHYYISTFARTAETLSLMYPEVADPMIDSRLNEWWRGIHYLMAPEDVAARYDHELEAREREGWFHHRPLGGQAGQDVEQMIYSFLSYLREAHCDQTVLVTTHGNWLHLLWRVMNNHLPTAVEQRSKEGNYANASVTVYEKVDGVMILAQDGLIPWADKLATE